MKFRIRTVHTRGGRWEFSIYSEDSPGKARLCNGTGYPSRGDAVSAAKEWCDAEHNMHGSSETVFYDASIHREYT